MLQNNGIEVKELDMPDTTEEEIWLLIGNQPIQVMLWFHWSCLVWFEGRRGIRTTEKEKKDTLGSQLGTVVRYVTSQSYLLELLLF
jgi:hypothetical protein